MSSFTPWRGVVFAILIAILALVETSSQFNIDSLKFAAIIHRHGDRSPFRTYPNDPHKNYIWPGGRGALSPLGSLQLYTLGKNLRRRYFRLLPADGLYSAEHMQVLSSARERTLMSSQSFLAGLMPPPSDRNPLSISWQPIPIHSIPHGLDNLIWQRDSCPMYEQTYLKMKVPENQMPEYRKFYEENAEWLTYLTNHTGMNVTSVLDVWALWDTLIIQRDNNLTLPAWTGAVFPDQMRVMAELGLSLGFQTQSMRLQRGGPLVSRIVGQMRDKQNGSSRSLYIYSAHDSTLLSVSRLLNLTDQTSGVPDYGATLAFELHCTEKNDCSQMEVKIVYYFKYSDTKPKHLMIPNCPVPCRLDRFAESINDILNYDYVNACKPNVVSSTAIDLETLKRNSTIKISSIHTSLSI